MEDMVVCQAGLYCSCAMSPIWISSRSAEDGTDQANDEMEETAEISPKEARWQVSLVKSYPEKVMWAFEPQGSEILHQDLHGDWHRP
jgi:hypothetical protein